MANSSGIEDRKEVCGRYKFKRWAFKALEYLSHNQKREMQLLHAQLNTPREHVLNL